MEGAGKENLRRSARERLAQVPPGARALQEDVVAARVQSDAGWTRARTVALYKSRPPELSVVALGNAAWRDGRRTVYPRVSGAGLEWRLVTSWSQFAPGAYGILEPVDACPVVDEAEIDLWIVPGLMFTLDGLRLGQGGGYYDRTLVHRREDAPAWGVCFTEQVVPSLPVASHDVRMDAVHTGRI